MPSTFAPVTDEETRPRGPSYSLEEAVKLLAPFSRVWEDRESNELREIFQEAAPQQVAQAEIENLAENLNWILHRARTSARLKDMVAGLSQSRELLLAANSALSSLDRWSRFHLATQSESAQIDAKWLPPIDCSGPGDFVELSSQIAQQIEKTLDGIRIRAGGHDIADRGGRHSYEERFLGPVKGRFVQEAFEVFDAYHPGSATSHDGSDFFKFVHHVYEYATNIHEEDSISIAYKLRELITPLHTLKRLKSDLRRIEDRMQIVSPECIEYEVLQKTHKRKSEDVAALTSKFIPNLPARRLIALPDIKATK